MGSDLSRPIAERLRAHEGGDIKALAQSLIDEANEEGGKDNVSVILVSTANLNKTASPSSRKTARSVILPSSATPQF